MPKLKHTIGTRFGRLIIIARSGTQIECLCDCGKKTIVYLSNLCTGHTQSCGCFRIEKTIARTYKHGFAQKSKNKKTDPTYQCWTGMIKRCYNSKCKDYPNYGQRGVVVSDEWRYSFATFLADMGEKPRDLTIERKDNSGPYSKENCYWATRKEQNRNTRQNRFITYRGKTQVLAAWAEELGIHHVTIIRRLAQGLSVTQALSKNPTKGNRRGRISEIS